jgi:hypothetical protein
MVSQPDIVTIQNMDSNFRATIVVSIHSGSVHRGFFVSRASLRGFVCQTSCQAAYDALALQLIGKPSRLAAEK